MPNQHVESYTQLTVFGVKRRFISGHPPTLALSEVAFNGIMDGYSAKLVSYFHDWRCV